MSGPGGTTCNHLFHGDGNANHRCLSGRGRLQNAVEMVQVIAIGGDVLLAQRKDLRHTARGTGHDVQHVITDRQNGAFEHCGRNREPINVDNTVSLGGVDGQHGIHARIHFLLIHRGHIYGRIHEWHRLMRNGRRIRADMGADDYITFQYVVVMMHLGKLKRHRERG